MKKLPSGLDWPLGNEQVVDRKCQLHKLPFLVGDCFSYGFGVRKCEKTVLKWYRLAASHGDACAQFRHGDYYEQGKGIEGDWKDIAVKSKDKLSSMHLLHHQ